MFAAKKHNVGQMLVRVTFVVMPLTFFLTLTDDARFLFWVGAAGINPSLRPLAVERVTDPFGPLLTAVRRRTGVLRLTVREGPQAAASLTDTVDPKGARLILTVGVKRFILTAFRTDLRDFFVHLG